VAAIPCRQRLNDKSLSISLERAHSCIGNIFIEMRQGARTFTRRTRLVRIYTKSRNHLVFCQVLADKNRA